MMRRLMWFTIGFTGACAIAVWLLPGNWIFPVVFVLGLFSAVLYVGEHMVCRVTRLVMFGCALGLCWFAGFQRYYLDTAAQLDGTEQTICLTASDYSYDTGYGIGVDASIVLDGKTYQLRAYLDGDNVLSPGDTVTGNFSMRYTFSTDTSEGTYHAGNGVLLLAYQKGEVEIHHASEVPRRYLPGVLARKLEVTIQDCFPQDVAPFAKALLLGKTTELSYEVDTNLKISGIRHVAAVSGLHVAILFGFIYLITLKKPVLTALAGIPVLALFAAVAGFTPSVSRACVMSGLMILGRCFDKEYDGGTALSFAVLVMLLANPLAVTSVSLQLSAASVVGIFLFYSPIYGYFTKKLPGKSKWFRTVAASVAVSISAMSLTTPLCAIYFGVVSLVGVLTNLLTLWAVSLVFYGILAVCALNLAWHTGAVALAGLVSVAIRYVLLCARILSRFPLAAVYTKSVYIVIWLIFCYCLIGLFLLRKPRRTQLLLGNLGLSLLLCVLLSWMEPLTDDVRMTLLDVGQGQSILLQAEGRTFLVDCGGDDDGKTADTIAETLLSQGIRHLDAIVLTHYDSDHSGALANLLSRIDTNLLIGPQTEVAFVPPPMDGQYLCVDEDRVLTFGETSIQICGSGYIGSGNENSLCVLFERENCAILITGDRSSLGEKLLMRKRSLPEVDVLIAGHHGAEDSTCVELLETVKPQIVMISVGENNIYGHPAPKLLERLQKYGCEVYRTDQNGTIVYRR